MQSKHDLPSQIVKPAQLNAIDVVSSVLEKESANTATDIVGAIIFLVVGIPPILAAIVFFYLSISGLFVTHRASASNALTIIFFCCLFLLLGSYCAGIGLTKLTGRNFILKIPRPVIATAFGGMALMMFLSGTGGRHPPVHPHPLISNELSGTLLALLCVSVALVWVWCLRDGKKLTTDAQIANGPDSAGHDQPLSGK